MGSKPRCADGGRAIRGGANCAVDDSSRLHDDGRALLVLQVDGFGGTTETGAEVRFSDREYFLSSGPIEDAARFESEPPTIWWPDDRAWCVASEIDLLATYVGGSATCIERLLGTSDLEVLPVSVDYRVDAEADELNRD